MKYLVKQKIFALGDNFDITDESGMPVFKIQGKIFSFGNKLSVYDLTGHKLVYIEQKLLRFLPEYNIYKDSYLVAKVKKQLTFLKAKFDIESEYGNFEVEGDVWGYSFSILRDGKVIAFVNKQLISFSDTYSVEVCEGEKDEFILALVIVIDQVLHDKNQNNS